MKEVYCDISHLTAKKFCPYLGDHITVMETLKDFHGIEHITAKFYRKCNYHKKPPDSEVTITFRTVKECIKRNGGLHRKILESDTPAKD